MTFTTCASVGVCDDGGTGFVRHRHRHRDVDFRTTMRDFSRADPRWHPFVSHFRTTKYEPSTPDIFPRAWSGKSTQARLDFSIPRGSCPFPGVTVKVFYRRRPIDVPNSALSGRHFQTWSTSRLSGESSRSLIQTGILPRHCLRFVTTLSTTSPVRLIERSGADPLGSRFWPTPNRTPEVRRRNWPLDIHGLVVRAMDSPIWNGFHRQPEIASTPKRLVDFPVSTRTTSFTM